MGCKRGMNLVKTKVVRNRLNYKDPVCEFHQGYRSKDNSSIEKPKYDYNPISCRCNIVHFRIREPNTYSKTHSYQATGNRKTCDRCFGFIRWCSKILFSRCVTSIYFAVACFDHSISIKVTRDSVMTYRPRATDQLEVCTVTQAD